jgi:tight adherence protein B
MIKIVIVMTFVAVFLTVLAILLGMQTANQSPAAELKRRLRRLAASTDTSQPNTSANALLLERKPFDKIFYLVPFAERVKSCVDHSGVNITPFRFICLSGMGAASILVFVLVLGGNPLVALLGMLAFGSVPFAFLRYRKQQRQFKFEEQFPDTLTMLARSLRAGHSLPAALELVGREMPEPTGGLFKIVFEQQQLGMRTTDSLRTLLEKIESTDLPFFVTIVRINYETGGNLAGILDNLAGTVRSRLQVRQQVKVFTAQGRMSGYMLSALPIIIFIMFYFLNPAYMNVFFTERICQVALLTALLAQCAGFLMVKRIIDIRI